MKTEDYLEKYVNSLIEEKRSKIHESGTLKEWDLIIDEVAENIYSWPLLSPWFCEDIINAAECSGKWTEGRHDFYPTNDMLLTQIGLNDIYSEILKEYVYPAAIHKWKLEGKTWNELSFENFIIKYLPNQQSHLSLHHDSSKITSIVTLNENFKGGGTYFERQKFLLKNPTGHVSIHPGNITHRHGARPITEGVRYVLVTFSN
tara:strand:+ start:1067 stop:1675 length:609 start_codon:yes stop_codon:yes gene_type:complete